LLWGFCFILKSVTLLRKSPPFLFCLGLLAFLLVIHFTQFVSKHWGVARRLEAMSYDWRLRLAAKISSPTQSVFGLVYISDQTIEAVADGSLGFSYGLYWPRHMYALTLQELHAQGATRVGLDILFAGQRPDHSLLNDPDKTHPDHYFAQTLRNTGNSVLAASQEVLPDDLFRTNAAAIGDIQTTSDPDGILRNAKPFRIYRIWHPAMRRLSRSVDLSSAVVEGGELKLTTFEGEKLSIRLDPSGEVDFDAFLHESGSALKLGRGKPFTEERVWQFGIVMAAAASGADLSKATVTEKLIVVPQADGKNFTIPLDVDGNLLIPWRIPIQSTALEKEPFEMLLQKRLERERGAAVEPNWKNKIVFIGSTATGSDLTDLGPTPLENRTLLLGKHWNVAYAFMNNAFLHPRNLWIDAVVLLLLVTCSWFVSHRYSGFGGTLLVLGLGVAFLVVNIFFFVYQRRYFSMVLPAGGMLLIHVAVVAFRAVSEQQEKKRVRSVFSRVVSPTVVQELLQRETWGLGGVRREITIFFADVRGFTEMTDARNAKALRLAKTRKLDPAQEKAFLDQHAAETLTLVNEYLAAIAEVVKAHGGTLDKYIGDCVMAFWGAPLPDAQHAASAVKAAIAAQRAVYNINGERAAENDRRKQQNAVRQAKGEEELELLPILTLGCGINSGEAIVGLMGSDAHIANYTAFGREVNLASRLESVSGRSRILIGPNTAELLKAQGSDMVQQLVELPAVTVKGIAGAVKVYEVPWKEQPASTGQGTVAVAETR
jgi:class 3 adenylate cyclase